METKDHQDAEPSIYLLTSQDGQEVFVFGTKPGDNIDPEIIAEFSDEPVIPKSPKALEISEITYNELGMAHYNEQHFAEAKVCFEDAAMITK